MRYLLYIVAVAWSLILIGCTSTVGTVDIAGKVLDEFTKEGTPKRTVIIHGLKYAESGLIPTDEIGRFYTDSSGHFTYTLKKIKDVYRYNFVFVADSTYSYSAQMVSLAELELNSKFLSFYLEKFTDLTIKIERINKTVPIDTLFISWKTDDIDGRIYPHKVVNMGAVPDFEFRWIGGKVKSFIETKTFANKNTVIHMYLFRNSRAKEMSDTIFCLRDVKNSFTFKY
ncbi:MAG: hypothetical protein GZ094_19200 [Mariniphaga sp.]|nr:hypothetical protein [Mariniphaga sp.]